MLLSTVTDLIIGLIVHSFHFFSIPLYTLWLTRRSLCFNCTGGFVRGGSCTTALIFRSVVMVTCTL